jgi:CxxC-x17-CxxC domain-containing protein
MAFRQFGPRQMFDAVCTECGKKTQVPFKPAADRPVYCKDCFLKRKAKG